MYWNVIRYNRGHSCAPGLLPVSAGELHLWALRYKLRLIPNGPYSYWLNTTPDADGVVEWSELWTFSP